MRQKSGGIQKTDERKEDNRMGFFDKKQCGICGKDAGRLLAYTLKDNKHLCDECFHKIYTGFNSLNAQFSLEHYRDHYLPYYEKTKKMREIFKTTCFYGGLYIDAEHRLFSISDGDYDNIMKKMAAGHPTGCLFLSSHPSPWRSSGLTR